MPQMVRVVVVRQPQPRALRQALETPGPIRNTLLAHALAAQLDGTGPSELELD